MIVHLCVFLQNSLMELLGIFFINRNTFFGGIFICLLLLWYHVVNLFLCQVIKLLGLIAEGLF